MDAPRRCISGHRLNRAAMPRQHRATPTSPIHSPAGEHPCTSGRSPERTRAAAVGVRSPKSRSSNSIKIEPRAIAGAIAHPARHNASPTPKPPAPRRGRKRGNRFFPRIYEGIVDTDEPARNPPAGGRLWPAPGWCGRLLSLYQCGTLHAQRRAHAVRYRETALAAPPRAFTDHHERGVKAQRKRRAAGDFVPHFSPH